MWDTHGVADCRHDLLDAKDVCFERPRKQVVAVRLEPPLWCRVKALALEKGISSSMLLRMWIVERCRKAKQTSRRRQRRCGRGSDPVQRRRARAAD
ncbi:MAG: hypothetical protein HYZ53_19345 [Planctomycetes bacterium]|nr:hypothetical protein [Planctomycetota bacterium]